MCITVAEKSAPLIYWKDNKMLFPNLADTSRKYHSAPPSSAAPERLFSIARQVLKPTRLNLKPANVEANLFLKHNLRAFGYGTDFEACPDEFIARNSAFMPPPDTAVLPEDDSECSDIEVSSDEDVM